MKDNAMEMIVVESMGCVLGKSLELKSDKMLVVLMAANLDNKMVLKSAAAMV